MGVEAVGVHQQFTPEVDTRNVKCKSEEERQREKEREGVGRAPAFISILLHIIVIV